MAREAVYPLRRAAFFMENGRNAWSGTVVLSSTVAIGGAVANRPPRPSGRAVALFPAVWPSDRIEKNQRRRW